MTQSELAREVGCKQSALSMFEQGDGTKLNAEIVSRIAKKFGLEISKEADIPPRQAPYPRIHAPATGYCPNPDCPSNHSYRVGERVFHRPDRQAADPIGGKYCAACGELLERCCPNCGTAVHDGAVCSVCGERYVAGRDVS